MTLSGRARAVGMSATLVIDERAKALAAAGRRIYNFGAGQPDFPTPEVAAAAGIAAIRGGKTQYTASSGTQGLRRSIADKLLRENGISVAPEQVLVSAGAKQSLYMVLAAVLDEGDEVLIPAPCWVSYAEQVKLLGGVARLISCDEATGFKLSAPALASAIGPRTRCLLLNTPTNPTGAVYTEAELRALCRLVVERNLLLVTDEIYEKIVYDGARHVSAAALDPEVAARTVTVNGVSKAFSMTGWRVGYAAGPAEWIDAAGALQSHMTGNTCSISQEATVAALAGAEVDVAEMTRIFGERRARVLALLAGARELRVVPPMGTFYVYPDASAYFGRVAGGKRIEDALDLAAWLLDEAGVAVVPGPAFGSDRHIRLSFATSLEVIEAGLTEMVRALQSLRVQN